MSLIPERRRKPVRNGQLGLRLLNNIYLGEVSVYLTRISNVCRMFQEMLMFASSLQLLTYSKTFSFCNLVVKQHANRLRIASLVELVLKLQTKSLVAKNQLAYANHRSSYFQVFKLLVCDAAQDSKLSYICFLQFYFEDA